MKHSKWLSVALFILFYFGLPLALRPSGVHPNAAKQSFSPSLLSTCPNLFHFLSHTSQLLGHTSSSPTYTTFTPLCSVVDPTHFHLVSLIPGTSTLYSTISLATLALCVASAIVLKSQQPMVVCYLGATMGPIGLWASCWFWPKSLIAAPAVAPPDCVVSSTMLPLSVTLSSLWSRVLAQHPTPNLEDQGVTLCQVSAL